MYLDFCIVTFICGCFPLQLTQPCPFFKPNIKKNFATKLDWTHRVDEAPHGLSDGRLMETGEQAEHPRLLLAYLCNVEVKKRRKIWKTVYTTQLYPVSLELWFHWDDLLKHMQGQLKLLWDLVWLSFQTVVWNIAATKRNRCSDKIVFQT